MPVAARVYLSSTGPMFTPPRPAPKTNSLVSVGLKLWVRVKDSVLPGPFFRSVNVSGQSQAAVVVP